MTSDLHITNYTEYSKHSLVATFIDPLTKIEGFVAFYRLNLKYPAFGATRIWSYHTYKDGLEDALRLAKIMMYKNAMASTPYPGAKSVIVSDKLSPQKRTGLLKRYAQFINFLSGRFVTGADVGVTSNDVKVMKTVCKDYIVGIKVDPVFYTVKGLLVSLDTALKEVFGSTDLSNKTLAVQGVGKTGALFVHELSKKVKKIYITDIQKQRAKRISARYKNVYSVRPEDIYKQKVDIFSPCALGGILNRTTIKRIKSSIIIGTANNQLESPDIGDKLHAMGVFYAPDYIVNAGGVISVVHEYENKRVFRKDLGHRVERISETLEKVINYSKKRHISNRQAADELAEEIINHRDNI
ncbi:hypothetical protein A3H80_03910 [Candidatus Roizmanbacteria bacterium RIFCSPLOWO2_02_FULL_37_19]|uniref:Glutamate/phenylalanine/leucine/valine/L-tryptophan dehydrogenase C-terminal domain-containing protein n=1 Tax=Candidatus Roizmanbacteria bacterium RIFCSPHIGHO2_02_FULL_37_24 TaxID=1802037 RepID=A0A1F7GW54_9BACT|nr:MAG: hypothetical protein A2862_03870 [Candidatus Roizmanbacteria bacterium RIFCSPHIGHO2_01_FULL_38_41]OGK23310.1 MAG: hypothetical protein A3C24_03900 [Candidatus Roizmanbacteria bacterium RIFCSPHIGHO2_02_FULL_37_24]OGK32323.1 MAG: hypothetical protein A3E10_04140 [Candidatus Roizmanbacteria bacterium RIFCSPHIGHO2_12_FULL_37_23]OGK44655.1 MAG: hypothetical protein A2956_03815 [Candidatus Roizmanbacteria bacterium RIFCSPLOWO2_01_FULL_37_57]OGK54841.1 MAG: hypothetical protein A3H80_03910 [Ca